MKCPNCTDSKLTPFFLEGLFRAHTCGECGGNWLLLDDYLRWKEHNPEYTFSQDASFEAEDSRKALLCPESGAIMSKYRIAHDSEHRLDYSAAVGGVWLDKGEWEYLKEKGLAGSLNRVFTMQWQKALKDDSIKSTFTEVYCERFGEESYEKVKELREWLNSHPRKADLRAYLLANDPYSAEK
uniref:Transcription factor zinc-finger domain-containing protein n=1 Tax=uncultured Thiotrichaceae bacterium TaxID=298394 RepID=A0A6S6TZZ9_9GAMM|nr:MAG: Unknown protein [uncultured Thiotrichaceae bacterium]